MKIGILMLLGVFLFSGCSSLLRVNVNNYTDSNVTNRVMDIDKSVKLLDL